MTIVRRPRRLAFVITCEHAVNRIPARYRQYFSGQRDALQSHHGYDRGALEMARGFARHFKAPLFHSTVSRLLVDLNRSPGHHRLHTETIRRLPIDMRCEICAKHYSPIRTAAEDAIVRAIRHGKRVIHVSSHSFTPVLDGVERNADIGLLYDPTRPGELALCLAWQSALVARYPALRVRRNYPYAGRSDGFASFLRKRYAADDYLGVELEVNQRMIGNRQAWAKLRRTLPEALREALGALPERWGGRDARRRS